MKIKWVLQPHKVWYVFRSDGNDIYPEYPSWINRWWDWVNNVCRTTKEKVGPL